MVNRVTDGILGGWKTPCGKLSLDPLGGVGC